jgi:hypothetical protein
MACLLENRFFDVNDVVSLDRLLQAHVGLDHLAVGLRAAQLEAPVAAARRHAAAGRDGLHDGHVGLQAVGARARHFAVDVEHRRTIDVDGLPALERKALDQQMDLLVLAVALHRDRLGSGGRYPAGRGDHVGELRARLVERVAPGARHHAEDRHLAAAQRRQRHLDLRIVKELAALERSCDVRARLGRRQAGELDLADERHRDRAALADASFEGQVRLLEDADAHRVAHSQLVALRPTQARNRPQQQPQQNMSHITSLHFSLLVTV